MIFISKLLSFFAISSLFFNVDFNFQLPRTLYLYKLNRFLGAMIFNLWKYKLVNPDFLLFLPS